MLNSAWFAGFIGIVLGVLSGMGIGGGTLLMLWLTLVLEMDTSTARSINLLFFIVCAGTVSALRLSKRKLHIKKLFPAILAGCITAGIFAWVSTVTDTQIFRKLFGFLLLFTGFRELFYRPKKAK